ncbi:hypothetical protein [Bradyrhizobium sp. BWA-3-5]|uniref:hypothetical protein n=1 Tax=Bradyrhizobium sp. BWA-3-5 TaxID=3080013 RepID=UPI00293F09FD|nr:hypothetical protein [Bradyrhizobium sp. BWA-3-5]WOH69603.1 hypothetical protein RX331_18700 [Bradyrhizobium sp. BWA-3-5]
MVQYSTDECSEGLLSIDLGLIAINETHAVFSIRIPRATLAENHGFLNVISDIAGDDGRLQLPAHDLPAPAPTGRLRAASASGWLGWITQRRFGSLAKRA